MSPMRLSELSDKELEVLHGNAVRLSRAGNEVQQSAAASLLPDIEEEVTRRSAQLRARPAKAPARKREAKRAAPAEPDAAEARGIRREPLVNRLPDMTDGRLLSLQRAATRISKDPEHSKHGSALTALPLIDAEIGRRASSLAKPAQRNSSRRNRSEH